MSWHSSSYWPDYDNHPGSIVRPTPARELADPVQPVVSIVTPFFNAGSVFLETVRSVEAQTFKNIEWIIVDDKSTDAYSVRLLRETAQRLDYVKVIEHVENRGPGAARNTGYSAARADYIMQLDSDDLLEPTAIEKMLWRLTTVPDAAFVTSFSIGFGARRYHWTHGFSDSERFLSENPVQPTCLVRKAVHAAVGGYDESIRTGLEDWDFWLKCAAAGYWGVDIAEPLYWYRRRASHTDRWADFSPEGAARFLEGARLRYPAIFAPGGLPKLKPHFHMPHTPVPFEAEFSNKIAKKKRRILLVVPWMIMGGADKFNIDLVEQLSLAGWEITVITTMIHNHHWAGHFFRITNDIFILYKFIDVPEWPRFISYMIESRKPDAVLLTCSQFGYDIMPYLRHRHHDTPFLDYNHIEEEGWNFGGHPATAVNRQGLLDLNVVLSEHLKSWMVARGADAERIVVCRTNIDAEQWRPDASVRVKERDELGLAPDAFVVLFAGRLVQQKQPRVLAGVILQVLRHNPDVRFIVAGAGPDEAALRAALADPISRGQVHAPGEVPSAKVKAWMRAADVFFLPSEWEGIALTFFEAMASGAAVLGADVGGQRELVTPDCGVLIPRSTEEEEIGRYAATLLNWAADPSQLKGMQEAARLRIVASFQIDRLRSGMIAAIDQAAELNRSQPREVVSAAAASANAHMAVEGTRIDRVADHLWHQAHSNPQDDNRQAASANHLRSFEDHERSRLVRLAINLSKRLEPIRQLLRAARP